MTPTLEDRKRWYTNLLTHFEESAEGWVWRDAEETTEHPIIPAECERYLIVQRNERDNWDYYLYPFDSRRDVEEFLADVLEEESWYIDEVIDLERNERIPYTVTVTLA